jgi:hypothetical protein
VVDGRTFSLNLDLSLPDPPPFGRRPFRHDVVWLRSDRGHDETLSAPEVTPLPDGQGGGSTFSGSRRDGLRHDGYSRATLVA